MAKKDSSRRSRKLTPQENLADPVRARSKLVDISLFACSATHSIENRSSLPKIMSFEVNNRTTHDDVSQDGKQIGGRLVANLTFKIEARYTADDPKPALKVSATYRLLYSVTPGKVFTERQLQSFVAFEAMQYAWPYAGEFIATTTNRMGLPSVRMPIYKKQGIAITVNV